jgi:hypothetical protein
MGITVAMGPTVKMVLMVQRERMVSMASLAPTG